MCTGKWVPTGQDRGSVLAASQSVVTIMMAGPPGMAALTAGMAVSAALLAADSTRQQRALDTGQSGPVAGLAWTCTGPAGLVC